MSTTTTKVHACLGGKKFVAYVITVLIVALRHWLGLNDLDVELIVALGCTFKLSQGLADGLSKGATSSVVQAQASQESELKAKAETADVALQGLIRLMSEKFAQALKAPAVPSTPEGERS